MKLIKSLAAFLRTFKQYYEMMEFDKFPTSHKYLPLVKKFFTHCYYVIGDEHKEFKIVLKSKIRQRLPVTRKHQISTFLCPNLKKLTQLSTRYA